MEDSNTFVSFEEKFPKVNKLKLIDYLKKNADLLYLPANFFKDDFVNYLNKFFVDELKFDIDTFLSEDINIFTYKVKKGVKSLLGINQKVYFVWFTNKARLFYIFMNENQFENPDKEESGFNIKNWLGETGAENIEQKIQDYLFLLNTSSVGDIADYRNRYIEKINPKQKLWLLAHRKPDDFVLAYLKISNIVKWEKEFEENKEYAWYFVLSKYEAKIIGFNLRDELIGMYDIAPESMKVKDEMGRNTVKIDEHIIFYTMRSNTKHFLEIYPLVSLNNKDRLREIARLNWIYREKNKKHEEFAFELMKSLIEKDNNPFDELSVFYIEYSKNKGNTVFDKLKDDNQMLVLLQEVLEYAGTYDLLTDWVEKWQVPYLDILALNKLFVSAAADVVQAKNILPFHQLVREKYQKKSKDEINKVLFDYEYAKHLIRCEQIDEAKKVLYKRLKQLPDESISDLLPPNDLDLTGNAAGQILKVKILEVLSDIEDEKKIIEHTKQLAVLQPLVEERINNLIEVAKGKLLEKAQELKQIMEPGGLLPQNVNIVEEKYKPLPKKLIEKNLKHPASRKGNSFSNLQKWIAKVEIPDHSIIKSYADPLNKEKYPQLSELVADIKYALDIENLETYISHGQKSFGINAFEGEPSFLIIGSDHLKPESPHYLRYNELKFAIAEELAHIYFKHARITSSDLWRGVIDKGSSALDALIAFIPVAGIFGKSLQGINKLNSIASLLQKTEKLEKVSQTGKGIIEATTTAVSVYEQKISKPKEVSKEAQLLASSRILQLTADRTALIFACSLNTAVRTMFIESPRYKSELPVVEKYGLRNFLLKKDEQNNFVHQDFAIRLANLFAFFLSDEYEEVCKALI
ncbi:MAG: hypothetical protein L3J74_10180 [Bacteroidales bacterium]|nr:hypothetical protein [Bacteroidales bacterium]